MPILSSVLAHTINVNATRPVSITTLSLAHLTGAYTRAPDPLQSTEFSFTRFLVPWLANFAGWSLYLDNDMVLLDDIAKLWDLRDERYAVKVVKHSHVPGETTKFLGQPQTAYEKKNWSSVMLFNNALCGALTPEYVNMASGLELHQFKWLANDDLIGALDHRWNHLVGYDAPSADVSLVHYTVGGPYFREYRDCEHSTTWHRALEDMLRVQQRAP